MFRLFSKKKTGPLVIDMVWMNANAKWEGALDLRNKDESTVFLFWFDGTLRSAQDFLSGRLTPKLNLTMAREARYPLIAGKPVIFAEHYPLKKKENELFQELQLHEVRILSALDEPLFQRFGGGRIIQLMRNWVRRTTNFWNTP